jgi:hypothetical protein
VAAGSRRRGQDHPHDHQHATERNKSVGVKVRPALGMAKTNIFGPPIPSNSTRISCTEESGNASGHQMMLFSKFPSLKRPALLSIETRRVGRGHAKLFRIFLLPLFKTNLGIVKYCTAIQKNLF